MDTTTNFLRYYRKGALLGSNSWESFNNYKLINADRNNLKFDCDSSVESKKALEEILGESHYTDTLISPQSFVTLYMRYFHSDLLEYNERYKRHIVPGIYTLKKRMVTEGLAQSERAITNPSIWAYFAKLNNVKVHDSILEFLHAVYTLPNFSSVCRGFNAGRVAKTQDNFIIALNHIYFYFKERELGTSNSELRYTLAKFLSQIEYNNNVHLTQEQVISEVQRWLDGYKSFASFVEKYYLQDFLEDPENANSKPVEIWEGMFNGKLQPSKEEFIPSVKFLTNAIKSRGIRMETSLGNIS